jgi:hypothetical protein
MTDILIGRNNSASASPDRHALSAPIAARA